MRRLAMGVLIVLGMALLSVVPGAAGDKPAGEKAAGEKVAGDKPAEDKSKKQLNISYHGQSFYILTTSKGKRIAFDPHLIADYGVPRGLTADIVLISHNHNDHTRVEALENYEDKKLKVIRGLKSLNLKADWNIVEETIDDVTIKSVGVYHDDSEGLMRGKTAVFIVEVDGWRIAHLGDLGHILTPAQVKRIGAVDVLMIPVGGIYTLNGSEAKKVMDQINPKEYVFPMHYGTKVFDATLPPDEFYETHEKRKVAISDDNEMKLNRDPVRPRPLTVQLHYWPKEEKKK
jgi:L-ascorbate metabolism protein UlaG (beta-lactamase superfamily)